MRAKYCYLILGKYLKCKHEQLQYKLHFNDIYYV